MKTSFRRSLILIALLILCLIAVRSRSAQATSASIGNAPLVNALTFNTNGAATGQVSVLIELWAIAWIRSRYMDTKFMQAAFEVVVGGLIVFGAGILIGSA